MSDFLDNAKDLIAAAAPTIGATLGGPLGGIAGKFVQRALGVDSEEAAMQALEQDPHALAKLKQAELDFKKAMREADIKIEQLHAEDRGSARELAKTQGTGFQMVLSAVFLFGYFALLYWFFSGGVPAELGEWARGQVGILIGILTSAVPQILAFWFGSSQGSKRKTELKG